MAPPFSAPPDPSDDLTRERWVLLSRVVALLEAPMAALGLVWLVLLIVDLTRGLSPSLNRIASAIWIVFILDFAMELLIAPRRGEYLRRHWLVAISLALPAVRILRVLRLSRSLALLRAMRGSRLLRVVTAMNRGMGSLAATMGRRGFGYVVALTALVTLTGGAGMYAFESRGGDLQTYGSAVWWTAMIMTTMGSEYWPRTAEGRVLCLFLSVYAFAVFGYVTATLASFFIDRDAARPDAAVAGAEAIEQLRAEIAGLREELRQARRAK